MKTYKRTLKADQTITDGKITFEMKKGEEFITGSTRDGMCHVFSRYWFYAPAKWFTKVKIFTNT